MKNSDTDVVNNGVKTRRNAEEIPEFAGNEKHDYRLDCIAVDVVEVGLFVRER